MRRFDVHIIDPMKPSPERFIIGAWGIDGDSQEEAIEKTIAGAQTLEALPDCITVYTDNKGIIPGQIIEVWAREWPYVGERQVPVTTPPPSTPSAQDPSA